MSVSRSDSFRVSEALTHPGPLLIKTYGGTLPGEPNLKKRGATIAEGATFLGHGS